MNFSHFSNRWFSIALLLVPGFVFPACSKKSSETVSMSANAFDSASPELKEKWKAASDAASKNDYSGTAANLIPILGKSSQLSPEQKAAVDQAWMELGNKAFAAANKGDEKATKVVLEMRDSKFGGSRR